MTGWPNMRPHPVSTAAPDAAASQTAETHHEIENACTLSAAKHQGIRP
jgi:hypothetical protein